MPCGSSRSRMRDLELPLSADSYRFNLKNLLLSSDDHGPFKRRGVSGVHAHQNLARLHELTNPAQQVNAGRLACRRTGFPGDTTNNPAVDVADDAGVITNHDRRYRTWLDERLRPLRFHNSIKCKPRSAA